MSLTRWSPSWPASVRHVMPWWPSCSTWCKTCQPIRRLNWVPYWKCTSCCCKMSCSQAAFASGLPSGCTTLNGRCSPSWNRWRGSSTKWKTTTCASAKRIWSRWSIACCAICMGKSCCSSPRANFPRKRVWPMGRTRRPLSWWPKTCRRPTCCNLSAACSLGLSPRSGAKPATPRLWPAAWIFLPWWARGPLTS